jgi:hypothetical protein
MEVRRRPHIAVGVRLGQAVTTNKATAEVQTMAILDLEATAWAELRE